MTIHAKKFSASSADRWVNCAGSVNACEGIKQTSSAYAEEGTKIHEIAAQTLNSNFLDRLAYNGELSEEDNAYLMQYYSYITTIEDKCDKSFIKVEQKVNYSNLAPTDYDASNDFFGTADCIIYDEDNKTLHVVDLKWGKGVKVEVENNYQLICYALGAINEYSWLYNIEQVVLHIVQPRMNNFCYVTLALQDLRDHLFILKGAVQRALQPDAVRTPHDKACKFCPAKNICPALLDLTINVSAFSKLELNDDDYKYILDNSDLVINFIKSVEEKIHNKLLVGGNLDGYKLVQGRSTRKWIDGAEERLKNSLGEAAYNKKLLGVTEADKIIAKELMEELTQKETGKPSLVKQEDKRKELKINNLENYEKGEI